MAKNKFKIYTLGCKVNQYDSGVVAGKLKIAGFSNVEENADLAIINTCAVTKIAVVKSKRMVNKAKKENPKAKIALMGCFPKIYKEEAAEKNVDLIREKGSLNNFVKEIKEKFARKDKIKKIIFSNKFITAADKSRYFIKVQDGCEQYCSYCIIPYARGALKSVKKKRIIKEVKEAVDRGYKEIVLTGIHLGLYGKEKNNTENINLAGLVKELIKIKNLGRIRLSSIEITEITDELIELIKNSNKVCRHLHIPLQSGNDKILKLMNRSYTIGYFLKKINKIRKAVSDIAITTDVIVGFPGETSNDFNKIYDFVKETNFSRLHVFSFSAHEKTPAFKMSGKVSKEEIKKRSRKLRELGEILEKNYRKKFINKELGVVIEKIKEKKLKGKTEFYFDVEFNEKKIIKAPKNIKAGDIVKLRLLK